MSEIQGVEIDIARKDEIPQEFTTEQMNNIKANMPTSMANVYIKPYEIMDLDGTEQVVGEVQKTIDGVKKKKSLYKKTIKGSGQLGAARTWTTIESGWSDKDFIGVDTSCSTLLDGDGTNYVIGAFQGYMYSSVAQSDDKTVLKMVTSSTSGTSSWSITVLYTKTSDSWEVV